MAALNSKLITKQMEWNANMTELNHLGAGLIARPHKMESKMDQLFSAKNYFSDNPMTSLLMGSKYTEEEISSNEWEWELKGADTRPLTVMENTLNGETTPGKFGQTFKLKLDENWYLPGDVISPGASDKKYQARVRNTPRADGGGFIYTLEILGNDQALFMPVKYFEPGQRWGKMYSAYGEGATESGSTQFSLPLALRNKMSLYRKQYKITDYAANQALAVAIPDSKGKLHQMWMSYAEVEYWQQWYRELERAFWYSRSTDSITDTTGRPVTLGPGVIEQLDDSHVHRYSTLTATLIEEFLMDIFYSRVKPGSGRKIMGYTGEYGLKEFHRAIQDWSNKSGFVNNIEMFTDKTKTDLNARTLSTGYQYNEYHMSNGTVLTMVHNPIFDDREINREIDPITGFPVESQRIVFLDFAGEGGKSNIKYMKKKDGFSHIYINGTIGPYGPIKGGTSAHSGGFYEMHVSKMCGVHFHDITRCGQLQLSRNN